MKARTILGLFAVFNLLVESCSNFTIKQTDSFPFKGKFPELCGLNGNLNYPKRLRLESFYSIVPFNAEPYSKTFVITSSTGILKRQSST
jgi:hypothetical protein